MVKNSKGEFNSHLLNLVEKSSYIDPSELESHNVKRGLRNANGTGVLVGATRVANVEGYDIVDGNPVPKEGQLLYRGISINDLVQGYWDEQRAGFEEVAFLLLFGKLPNSEELDNFKSLIANNQDLPLGFVEDVILRIPSDNIMNKLQRIILSLYSYDNNADNLSLDNQISQSMSIIAKMPIFSAYSYMAKKHYYDGDSLILHNPLRNVSFAENILHLIRPDSEFTQEEVRLLDTCLIVHAEHGGGNNSAFANHVVSSSGTDIYSAMATSVGSLKGPKHGGANFQVQDMVEDIKENTRDWTSREEVRKYINKLMDKEAYDKKGLVYGMGHAIYTLSDPRSELLKTQAKIVAEAEGFEDDYYLLENIESLTKELFKERKGENRVICANVDLYSGLVYTMLGINKDLYTPIFATARSAGWCAHRLEQIRDDKIIRPAYVNLVENSEYISLVDRK